MKWFLNQKIAVKLGISFGIILISLIGMTFFTYVAMNRSQERKLQMIKDLELSGFLKEKWSDHLKFVKDLEESMLMDKAFEGQLDPTKCGFGKWYYSFEPQSQEMKVVYEKIADPHKMLHQHAAEIKNLQIQKRDLKEQISGFEKNIVPTLRVLEKDIRNLSMSVNNKANNEIQKSNESEQSMVNIFLLVALVVTFVGVFAGLFISRVIALPVKKLSSQAEAVADGDLTVEIIQKYNDEIGTLEKSFGRMVGNLRETIGEVNKMSSSVVSASGEISSSTEELAAGTQEQSSQAAEVASAVEEMTRTILENSKNAGLAAETANKAREAAQKGGIVVEETVVGMKSIAEVVDKSAQTVKALGKSSDEIGEIINVIDDIADQTNLLALNAAIEAARAGEHGRGFSVVADEVRKLAERTSKATKEIAVMIKSIQNDTIEAVKSMDEGTRKVEGGIKLADQAGVSLREIVDISQKVTDMVTQIAAASEEQSSASEQISKNIEAISSVTNQSASGTQQIARSAEDLNRMTDNLQELLHKFKLTITETDKTIARKITPRNPMQLSSSTGKNKSNLAVRENGRLVSHTEV